MRSLLSEARELSCNNDQQTQSSLFNRQIAKDKRPLITAGIGIIRLVNSMGIDSEVFTLMQHNSNNVIKVF